MSLIHFEGRGTGSRKRKTPFAVQGLIFAIATLVGLGAGARSGLVQEENALDIHCKLLQRFKITCQAAAFWGYHRVRKSRLTLKPSRYTKTFMTQDNAVIMGTYLKGIGTQYCKDMK